MQKVFAKRKKVIENIVCKYLEDRKNIIIEKEFKYKKILIDLIVYDEITKELVFVKIKNSSSIKEFNIKNRFRGKDKLRKLAKSYNCDYGLYDIPVRFDIIKVFLTNSAYKLVHRKRIFM